jgi:two-component system sensor histidine kinase KdpD
MTRIDAGALRPTIEPVDLSDLIGSTLKRVARQLAGHRLRTALSSELPMVLLDFVLAEQVLVNVLENAGKFAPAGTEIVVSAVHFNDEVEIRIEDQGPGIPEQDLPKVFERFFRAPVGDHRPAGVGLGLSVCKGFVEAMGGTITAENREDAKGVAITIRFPNVAVERAI